MERFTLKELREIATKHRLPNRSKYKKKEELYNFLIENLGNLEDIKEVKTVTIPKVTKPILRCLTVYDYLVIQSKSTKNLFPLITKDHKINGYVYYLLQNENVNVTWAINGSNKGPIGFNKNNSPFYVKYIFKCGSVIPTEDLNRYQQREENILEDDNGNIYYEKNITGIWFIPTIDPVKLRYKHLLKKYAKKILHPAHGKYLINGFEQVFSFCKELSQTINQWNYIPERIADVMDTLKTNNLKSDQCIFVNKVNHKELKNIKKHIIDTEYDSITSFKTMKVFNSNKGLKVAYLEGINK